VTLGARRFASRSKLKSALVFDVARRTGWRETLLRLMDGSVMTGQTGSFRDFRAKGGRHMAGRTIVGENRVAVCQGSGVERAPLSSESGPSEPGHAKSGSREGEPALPTRDGICALEIVQVDSLRELFRGSGAPRHINT